jgi:hypothetical protein
MGLVFDASDFASFFADATKDKRYLMADFMLNSDTPRLGSERF